jgi:hypothetical protein
MTNDKVTYRAVWSGSALAGRQQRNGWYAIRGGREAFGKTKADSLRYLKSLESLIAGNDGSERGSEHRSERGGA